MRERLQTALLLVISLCAVVTTGLFVNEQFAGPAATRASAPTRVAGWQAYTRGGLQWGKPDAPVTLVAFSDYECPFCERFAHALDTLRAEYPAQLRVVYHHFPLENAHPLAREAAIAVECAAQQGRGQALHDSLFAWQDSLAHWLVTRRLGTLAAVADTAAYERCRLDPAAARRLDADIAAGKRFAVRATPTLIINGWRFEGALSLATLDSVIRAQLAARKVATVGRG